MKVYEPRKIDTPYRRCQIDGHLSSLLSSSLEDIRTPIIIDEISGNFSMFGRNPRPNPSPSSPAGSYNRIPSGRTEAYESRLSDAPRAPRGQSDISRPSGVAHAVSGGQEWQLRPAKSPGDQFTFGNMYRIKVMSGNEG